MVYAGCGATIDVERYAEVFEGFLDEVVVAVNHLLRGDALLARAYSDGYAMLVAAANEYYLLLLQSEVSHIDVRWYIYTSEVTYMYASVGIGKRCRDSCSLVLLFFHCCIVCLLFVFLFSIHEVQYGEVCRHCYHQNEYRCDEPVDIH